MLRDIYIIKDSQILFHKQFGSSIDWETLSTIVQSLPSYFEKSTSENEIAFMDIENFHLTYSIDNKNRIFFIFLSDLTDAVEDLEKQLIKAREEFTTMFEDVVNVSSDQATFHSFNPIAEMIHQNLRPKIALVGFSGVGKTTISKLIRAEEIPMDHVPTMTGDILTIKIGKLHFHLWDFAGQEQYSFLWPQFIQDSDAVLIVSDSTIQNIDKSKFFIDLVKNEVPNARLSVIANKQDLPDAIEPKKIEKLLGVKSYSMIAVDPENRAKMIQIIGEILNLSPQISPLIRPLLDRDKAIEEAEILLMKGDFKGAIEKFKSIAAYSRELGDDKISLDFLERAKLIESKLKTQETMKRDEKVPTSSAPEIPEIPASSKPIHPEAPIDKAKQKEMKPVAVSPSSSHFITIEDHYNFIDRNLYSILSNNYLNFNFLDYDKNQVSTIISNLMVSTLPDFFQNVKNKINYSEIPIFPSFPPLEKSSNLSMPQPKTEIKGTLTVSKEDSSEIIRKYPQKSLEEILDDGDMSIKEKIKYIKKELSHIEKEITELKKNFKNETISKEDYNILFNKLREKKKKYQETISDLSIQEIKHFDMSFPEDI
ncbi:MAG: GTP-binding protein [Candidatus Helarchaeota archaeon]|nr:GTP-binding protein [Candidatus Helarchaeota archaeon]